MVIKPKKTLVVDVGPKNNPEERYKQADEVLAASELRYRRLFEAAKDGIMILDAETGQITDVNKFMIDLMGSSHKQFLEKKIWEIGSLKDFISNKEKFAELQQQKYIRYENMPLETASGKRIDVEFVSNVYSEGYKDVIQCNIRVLAERNQAKEELVASEMRYRRLFEAAKDGIIILDGKTGQIIDVNKFLIDLLGFSREQFLGKKIWEIGFFKDIISNKDKFAELQQQKYIRYENMPLETASGERIEVEFVSNVYSEGNNQVIQCNIRNITERKNIETGLEKTRKELAVIKQSADEVSEFADSIINTVREPLITLDQDLRVVKASRSFYEFFKVKPEDTVGQLIYNLGNKQWDIPKLRELLEDILPQKAAFDNYEVEHNFSTIGRRIMLLNARQIQRGLGKERIILLAIEDITVRKEIEAGLEKTRKELAVIKQSADEALEYADSTINTIREPLIVLDQDLKVVSASRAFYEVFKVKHEDTVGQLIYNLGNKQWDIPKLRELLEDILPKKAAFDNYEVEHNFSTIGRRIMLLNARQIQRGLGKERIILLAIEDITVRREIEKGMEKTRVRLEELSIELKRTSRVKSEFLANMSHELRTPLNSIIGFSEVLYDETFGKLSEKQKEYVNYVLVSGKHLLLLINDVLDMAKVEAGKMELSISSLSLKKTLEDALILVKGIALKKEITLFLKIDENIDKVEADERKFKEVLYNLFSNAIKFTLQGGKVDITAKIIGSDIEVAVNDTGIGIAPENISRVFEAFTRIENSYNKAIEGTGLGLGLSKKLVELHGGKILIESAGLNKGTTVKFTLPIKARKDA